MRNILVVLSLFCIGARAQSSKTITNTNLKEVKIFQTGAQISRSVKTTVEDGITQLNMEGLSANIDKNSILVSGTGDVVLLSVVHQLNYLNAQKKSSEQNRLE